MNRLLVKRLLLGLIGYGYFDVAVAAIQSVDHVTPDFSKTMVWNTLFSLLLVLGLIFVCVWMLRKMKIGNTVSMTRKIQILGGVALGMREKVVVLQVGGKQLVLAVTPGRIETLTTLEGEDCVKTTDSKSAVEVDASFAQKLMLALKNRPDVE